MKSASDMFNPESRGLRAVRGSALVIALVLLLILTVLGLASMQSTGLQERMAGNFDQRHQAFQLAEMGLRIAEREFAEASRLSTAILTDEAINLVRDNWPAACPDLNQLACSGASVSADLACVAAFHTDSWISVTVPAGNVRYMEIPLGLMLDADRCMPPQGISRQISAGGDAGTGEAISGFDSVRIFIAEGVAPDNTSMVLIQAVFEGPRDWGLTI